MNKQHLLPSRDAVTQYQTATLLSIAQTMLQYLSQPEIDVANPHKGPAALDGGARASCEATLINVCNRLDLIVTDNARFELELHRLLEAQFARVLTEQIAFLKSQTAASLALNSPTYLHKPKIINAGDGNFVALLGDPDNPACLGIGNSPAAACADFDKSFNGELTENQLKWLEQHPDNKEQTAPKQPRKKK